jgi:predicted amidohydrolase
MVKIALVQMVCEKAAIARNLAQTAHYIEQATAEGVDIIAFPETNLTGYVNPEQHPTMVLRLDGPEVAQACALTEGKSLTALVGILEENPNGKPFISQLVVRDGRLVGVYRKMTQGEAEDGSLEDWHAMGESVPVFRHDALTFGIAICADSGNEHVFAECARQGARIVFEVAAPGLFGDQATRNWESGFRWWEGNCQTQFSGYTQTYGLWIAVATQAGRTVDEDFPGGGYVFAPDGRRVFATPDWSAGMAVVEVPV